MSFAGHTAQHLTACNLLEQEETASSRRQTRRHFMRRGTIAKATISAPLLLLLAAARNVQLEALCRVLHVTSLRCLQMKQLYREYHCTAQLIQSKLLLFARISHQCTLHLRYPQSGPNCPLGHDFQFRCNPSASLGAPHRQVKPQSAHG